MKADATTIPAAEISAACDLILTSDLFRNAPRLSRLLSFLIEKAIFRDAISTSEYAIGIEVFGRPPAYNTGDDPIVRVQIGRLRKKLKIYYATIGAGSILEITIPVGCYMPTIRWMNIAGKNYPAKPILIVEPLKCLSELEEGKFFTLGLHEELVHHLHKTLVDITVMNSPFTSDGGNDKKRTPNLAHGKKLDHRLEGCVQIDMECVRTSIRLTDYSSGHVTWSGQFSRDISFTIALQEELAISICDALRELLRKK